MHPFAFGRRGLQVGRVELDDQPEKDGIDRQAEPSRPREVRPAVFAERCPQEDARHLQYGVGNGHRLQMIERFAPTDVGADYSQVNEGCGGEGDRAPQRHASPEIVSTQPDRQGDGCQSIREQLQEKEREQDANEPSRPGTGGQMEEGAEDRQQNCRDESQYGENEEQLQELVTQQLAAREGAGNEKHDLNRSKGHDGAPAGRFHSREQTERQQDHGAVALHLLHAHGEIGKGAFGGTPK